MSLYRSIMGDFDDDMLMGNHMNAMNMQMRSLNRMMNSFMPNPFNMLTPFDGGFPQNVMMERGVGGPMDGLFGFPAMPNMNRLLSADIGAPNGAAYCSSSVISMSAGPDGRPQIYQATSSTKTGPGGIRETRKTVQDSSKGIKTMAIGHHIGDRAHIIEKEQDVRSGQMEERQEFINLEEEQADDFDREFTKKARGAHTRPQEILSIEDIDDDEDDHPRHHQRQLPHQQRRQLPALPAPPQQNNSSTLCSSSSRASANAAAAVNAAVVATAATTATQNGINHNSSNNNNNYLSATPRRAFRSHHHHLTGVTPRRPLRTPSSSPLAMTPTNHSHSTAATPSVHPHPYNASAARRNYRSKHTKQHQQPHATATQSQPQQQQEAISKRDHNH